MNKLSFTKIEIENFRSIKNKVTLDIKPGLFSIEGVNKDEAGYNGAGKSSIISALYWCLTGNALTNEVLADEVINSVAGKDCKVTVHIASTNDSIKITRTRKDSEFGNNLLLEVNEQNLSCHKISDTQERLNNLIKLPLDLIKNTLMITSNMESAFSELTPAQRVQTLENIRDYTVWNNLRDNANKDIKTYKKLMKELELSISSLNGSKVSFSQILFDVEKDKQNYIKEYGESNYSEVISKNEMSKSVLQEEINRLSKQKDLLQNEIVASNNSELFDEMNKIKDEGTVLSNEISKLENDKKQQLQELPFKRREITNKLNVINDWFIKDTCPTCKRKLERDEKQIEEKNAEKADLESQLAALDKAQTDIEDNFTAENERIQKLLAEKREQFSMIHKKYLDSMQEANIIPKKIKDLEVEIKALNDKLLVLDIDTRKAQNAIDTHFTRIKTCDENLAKYTKQVEELNTQIEDKTKELKDLEDKCKVSTFFYDLLGPKGELRPYLLKKDIEYLNAFIHHYTSRFFKGTDVKLELNDSNIKILIETNDGIKKSISSLSGGEKKRVNLSIQLALYDLMQSVSQTSFNILCLDEVESQMDPIGCEQLIDIIHDKADEIDTVYWITNNDMVKENIINKIVCSKVKGVTTIQVLD